MVEEDLSRIPLGQAQFLVKLIDSKDNIGFAEGKAQGSSAKELLRKGYIIPFGSLGRRVRWKLIKQFSNDQSALLRSLAGQL